MTSACTVPNDLILSIPSIPSHDPASSRGLVQFRVDDDENAWRVECVLTSIGYEAKRVGADELDGHDAQLERVIRRLAWLHHLSESESELLRSFVLGQSHAEISAARGLSMATVRWREKSVIAKTRTKSREGLLRLVLESWFAPAPAEDRR